MSDVEPCDHHGPDGTLAAARTRRRMLAQLRAADLLASTINAMIVNARAASVPDGPSVIYHDIDAWLALLAAVTVWSDVRPRGDEWAPR